MEVDVQLTKGMVLCTPRARVFEEWKCSEEGEVG